MLMLCLQEPNNETYKKALEMTSKVSTLGYLLYLLHPILNCKPVPYLCHLVRLRLLVVFSLL